MKNKLTYTFKQDLENRLNNDKEFRKSWNELHVEYTIAKKLYEKRMEKNLSQRDLAEKVNTTQAVISRIETMRANPSVKFLKKVVKALDTDIVLQIR